MTDIGKLRQLPAHRQRELATEWTAAYERECARGLKLDLTRGKPGPEQVSLSIGLDGILKGNFRLEDGTDARNYGGLYGIPESRRLGAALLGARPREVLCGGNSSLTLMYHYVCAAQRFGIFKNSGSWQQETQVRGEPVKFLCPVPGYDRHFTICEALGIRMLPIPMTDSGPDMDAVEAQTRVDPMIKGIWCVPRFSNPTGITYSAETIARFAHLAHIAGPDFRILWDNAYAVHALEEDAPEIPSLLELARAEGTEESVVMFASTSKITFAGGGISWLATSEEGLARFGHYLATMQIGPDKVNQLRHVRLLPDIEAMQTHMNGHAKLLRPKFDLVLERLDEDLAMLDIAHWTKPAGGYFVSFDSLPGLARHIVEMAATAGVKLTPAGATWPHGQDPDDSNIRLAPSYPSLEDLDKAMRIFTLCVKLASIKFLSGANQ